MTQARRLTIPGLLRLTPIRLTVGIVHHALAGPGPSHEIGERRVGLPVGYSWVLSHWRYSFRSRLRQSFVRWVVSWPCW